MNTTTTAPSKKPGKRATMRANVTNTILAHLLELGCTQVAEESKVIFHAWEVTLPTQAGLLNISVSLPKEWDSELLMIHGRFPNPEKFPREFCEYNHINPYSGKWNVYCDVNKPQELTDTLRYYSRMIPCLDITE